MFRNEKPVVPGILPLSLAAVVAIGSFAANHYSPVIGLFLAIMALIMIALQVWFSFRIWPTVEHKVNPYFFGLYWGVMAGLVVPYLFSVMSKDGAQGIWELISKPF